MNDEFRRKEKTRILYRDLYTYLCRNLPQDELDYNTFILEQLAGKDQVIGEMHILDWITEWADARAKRVHERWRFNASSAIREWVGDQKEKYLLDMLSPSVNKLISELKSGENTRYDRLKVQEFDWSETAEEELQKRKSKRKFTNY